MFIAPRTARSDLLYSVCFVVVLGALSGCPSTDVAGDAWKAHYDACRWEYRGVSHHLVEDLAGKGLLGLRLGKPSHPDAAHCARDGLTLAGEGARLEGFPTSVPPAFCWTTEDRHSPQVAGWRSEDGALLALAVTRAGDEHIGHSAAPAWVGPRLLLYVQDEGARGTVYCVEAENPDPARAFRDDLPDAVCRGYLAARPEAVAELFPELHSFSDLQRDLAEGTAAEVGRALRLLRSHERLREDWTLHQLVCAAISGRPATLLDEALAGDDPRVAGRVLAAWVLARDGEPEQVRAETAPYLSRLVERHGMVGLVRFVADQGRRGPYNSNLRSELERANPPADDSDRILYWYWDNLTYWEDRLQRPYEQTQKYWRMLFQVMTGPYPIYHEDPQVTFSIRGAIRLAHDHDARLEAVARYAAGVFYRHVGPAHYAQRLTELLDPRWWPARKRRLLLFDPLREAGLALPVDPDELFRQDLASELEQAWEQGGWERVGALGIYLARVEATFSEPAQFEAHRRQLLERLLQNPQEYADLVLLSHSLEAPSEDPVLLDWLPAPARQAVQAEFERTAEARAERRQIAERYQYRLEFRGGDLGSWWLFATARDGLDAPRFEAAERGAQVLAEYFAELDATRTGGVDDRQLGAFKAAAWGKYLEHYGWVPYALFVVFPLELAERRAALDVIANSDDYAQAYLALRDFPGPQATTPYGDDPIVGSERFLSLARQNLANARRESNPLTQALQGRYQRLAAQAYLDTYGEEAFVDCLMPRASKLLGNELLNAWCNYGVATPELVDAFNRSGTLYLEIDDGLEVDLPFTLEAPEGQAVRRYGPKQWAIRPGSAETIVGTYRLRGTLRGLEPADVPITFDPPEEGMGQVHQTQTQSLGQR